MTKRKEDVMSGNTATTEVTAEVTETEAPAVVEEAAAQQAEGTVTETEAPAEVEAPAEDEPEAPAEGLPGDNDDDESHEGEDLSAAEAAIAALPAESQEALGALLEALPDEVKAEIGLAEDDGNGDGEAEGEPEAGPTSESEPSGEGDGTGAQGEPEGTPASTPDGDDGSTEGADTAPPAVFQPPAEGNAEGNAEGEGNTEGQAETPKPKGFTHDGHKAWSMMPSRRTAPLSRMRGTVYVIAGVNPPAQWEHNGRMVRVLVPAQPVEGWELGKVISLMHIKTNAWTGDWCIIGIATDGVLVEGSKLSYRGNAGADVTLKEKAGIWWGGYEKGATLPDKAGLLPEQRTTAPPAEDEPKAEDGKPEGDGEPEVKAEGDGEGEQSEGQPEDKQPESEPEAKAEDNGSEPQPGSQRAARNQRRANEKDRQSRRNKLHSGFEGAGRPA